MEDEFHFECPIYKMEKLNLLEYIDKHFKNVVELQAFDKFIWLMSQEDPLCILKVAKVLRKANDMRQKGNTTSITVQGPIGTIIIFRQCVSHIFYKKAVRYYQKATFL